MTYWEVVGTVFALLGVWLTTRQNIWCWLVSIIAIFIYIYIFYQSKLYGDSGLQVFYLGMSLYGWYEWKYGKKEGLIQAENTIERHLITEDQNNAQQTISTELPVTKATRTQWLYVAEVGGLATVVLAFVLKKTDSNVPWFDASTTAFSLVATWMMARKILENWLLWILIDAVYVGIYIYKDLYVTAGQYFIFTILAAYGYWEWKKQLQKV